jgi:hypothetical protein
LVSHEFGWELRLMTTDLLRSQVCRSSEEILSTHEQWKAAMLEKGWRAAGNEPHNDEVREQAPLEEMPPIDHAPVPPLTTPDDTEGG